MVFPMDQKTIGWWYSRYQRQYQICYSYCERKYGYNDIVSNFTHHQATETIKEVHALVEWNLFFSFVMLILTKP